jgi:catalase
VVPGIDFSNDPLLAGRIHSYIDTQITRLGGANFHEIPINAPLAAVHNNQRDGLHRQAIPRGRVAYEPNSLGGGCPFQAGAAGFVSFPQPVDEGQGDKLRGKPEKFADHYTQATLFYDSQTAVEQAHIAGAFRFELSKLTVPAIRERMVSSLVNVSAELAATVAAGLGIPVPPAMPKVLAHPAKPEVAKSAALSLMALPGEGGIRSRSVAILVADGVDGDSIAAAHAALRSAGAKVHLIAPRLGAVKPAKGEPFDATGTLENSAPVLFDGVVLPDGAGGVKLLGSHAEVMDFISNQYRHGKTIFAIGASKVLLERAGVAATLADGEADPGVVMAGAAKAGHTVADFIAALGKHRHPERELALAER